VGSLPIPGNHTIDRGLSGLELRPLLATQSPPVWEIISIFIVIIIIIIIITSNTASRDGRDARDWLT